MDPQLTDENDKRFEVVREIVMTEKQYCVNLDFVIKVSPSENIYNNKKVSPIQFRSKDFLSGL